MIFFISLGPLLTKASSYLESHYRNRRVKEWVLPSSAALIKRGP